MNRMIYINTCQISLSFTELCCQHFYNKENQIWGSNVKVCGHITRSPSLTILSVEGCHIHCLGIGWMYGERAHKKWWVIRSTS